MNNAIIALFFSVAGIALLVFLGSGLLGWGALGFFAVCSFITLWFGNREQAKKENDQKIKQLEKRIEELENKA
jgi:membrane protein implicated in regulation of membrane protease activity